MIKYTAIWHIEIEKEIEAENVNEAIKIVDNLNFKLPPDIKSIDDSFLEDNFEILPV